MQIHPQGEWGQAVGDLIGNELLDTFGGRIRVEWDPSAKVTAFGPLSYFIHFLKTSGLWEEWARLCPLQFTSNNAPSKEKILLSILAGHKRYAHIATCVPTRASRIAWHGRDRQRRLCPPRIPTLRGSRVDAMDGPLDEHDLRAAADGEGDVEGTVKTLYGKQEEARVGYNPAKPGRPSITST